MRDVPLSSVNSFVQFSFPYPRVLCLPVCRSALVQLLLHSIVPSTYTVVIIYTTIGRNIRIYVLVTGHGNNIIRELWHLRCSISLRQIPAVV